MITCGAGEQGVIAKLGITTGMSNASARSGSKHDFLFLSKEGDVIPMATSPKREDEIRMPRGKEGEEYIGSRGMMSR